MLFRRYESAIFAAAMLLSTSASFADSEAQHQQPSNSAGSAQKAQSADTAGAEHRQSLAPGSVAGVQKAQTFSGPTTESWLIGAGVVIGGVILITSGQSHDHSSTTSTGSR